MTYIVTLRKKVCSLGVPSLRVGAKRRPMTGSAKQSMPVKEDELLRRYAPRHDGPQALAPE
jgi:hypothetical protein